MIAKLVEKIEQAIQAEPARRKISDGQEQVPGEYAYSGSVANKASKRRARSSACSTTERKSTSQNRPPPNRGSTVGVAGAIYHAIRGKFSL
jgi:hypothetical protein